MARLRSLLAEVRVAMAGFEPDRWSGADCAEIAEDLARVEKACAAAGVGAGGRMQAA